MIYLKELIWGVLSQAPGGGLKYFATGEFSFALIKRSFFVCEQIVYFFDEFDHLYRFLFQGRLGAEFLPAFFLFALYGASSVSII